MLQERRDMARAVRHRNRVTGSDGSGPEFPVSQMHIKNGPLTAEQITRVAAAYYGVEVEELHRKHRVPARVQEARRMASFYLLLMLDWDIDRVASYFGYSYSTALKAREWVRENMELDCEYRDTILGVWDGLIQAALNWVSEDTTRG